MSDDERSIRVDQMIADEKHMFAAFGSEGAH
jgi:hypothetical protein